MLGWFFEEDPVMRIAMTQSLFAWECLEDSPSLATVREVLGAIPDERLLAALRTYRWKGRDEYPVHVVWAVVLLKGILRHVTTEATLGELKRNRQLRELIGIEKERKVPKKWNVSRFLKVLGRQEHVGLLREVFDEMIRRLGSSVPDLGRRTAGDATHLRARREDEEADAGLPRAEGGRKEYTDEKGQVTHVLEWFGYKLHLLTDTRHEVALAYQITSPKVGDVERLPALVEEAENNLPKDRMNTLAYDKAADAEEVHRFLKGKRIAPVIENRSLWKEEFERMLPDHNGTSNVVYDEAGTVHCYDTVSKVPRRRPMSYIGHEAKRGTLKYRCPARHEGFSCPSDKVCNAGKAYGKTVRVKRQIDLRRFPPIPRATKTFERLYKGRSAVERVNARLKIFWGSDDGNITGARRFHALVGTVLIVHAAFATCLAMASRYEGTLGKLHLSHLAKALREKVGVA
jgi:hypothetical protein